MERSFDKRSTYRGREVGRDETGRTVVSFTSWLQTFHFLCPYIFAITVGKIQNPLLTYMPNVQAIREYWESQVVGKQSNIGFRHVVGDMVLDAGQRKAVVKWLAAFDNLRYRVLAALHKQTS